MSLEQDLTDRLTQAIKTKDAPTADVVRMIKTRIQERRTAKDFSGTINDAVVLEVIGLPQASSEGDHGIREARGARSRAGGDASLRDRLLRRLPAQGPRRGGSARARAGAHPRPRHRRCQAGGAPRGDIMKTHKGQVEAADVKRLAEQLLKS